MLQYKIHADAQFSLQYTALLTVFTFAAKYLNGLRKWAVLKEMQKRND